MGTLKSTAGSRQCKKPTHSLKATIRRPEEGRPRWWQRADKQRRQPINRTNDSKNGMKHTSLKQKCWALKFNIQKLNSRWNSGKRTRGTNYYRQVLLTILLWTTVPPSAAAADVRFSAQDLHEVWRANRIKHPARLSQNNTGISSQNTSLWPCHEESTHGVNNVHGHPVLLESNILWSINRAYEV